MVDALDAKPLDPAYALGWPDGPVVQCSGATNITAFLGASGIIFMFKSRQVTDSTCTINFSSASSLNVSVVSDPAPQVVTVINPGHPAVIFIPGQARQVVSVTGPTFAPWVKTSFTLYQYALSSGPILALPLAGLAIDAEDGAPALAWSLVSGGKYVDATTVSNSTAYFAVGNFSCGQDNITLAVTDSSGLTTSLTFLLVLLGGAGPNLLQNPSFAQPASSPTLLPGWTMYVWAGSFSSALTSANGYPNGTNTSVLVRGLAAGRWGIHQTLQMTEGTYVFSGWVAAQMLFPAPYGYVADLLVLSDSDPMIIKPFFAAAGNQPWQFVSLAFSFNTPGTRTVTVYVRLYGTGIREFLL